MKVERLVLLVALVLLAMAACTRSETSAPIRIGAVYPLSGAQGPGGIEEFRGVRLAADLVNADGGVERRRIELLPIDVPSGDAAPAAIERLYRDGVRLVMGSYGSTISVPASVAAERRGMLFWETGAVGDMARGQRTELVFRVTPTGSFLGARAIAFVADRLAPLWHRDPASLRIAVAFVDDVYGRSVARGALDEIERRGLQLVGSFGYDPLRADIAAVIRRVADARPDVFFVAAYLKDGIELRRQAIDQGLDARAMIGTSSSYCMPEFGRALGADAIGVFASDKPDEQTLGAHGVSAAAAALLRRAGEAYEQRYGEEMSAAALAGFSAAWALFHDVLPVADEPSPTAVGEAARAADVPLGGLPNGSGLRFGPPGTPDADANLRAASVIGQWVDVNEMAIVWPERFTSHPVVPVELAS